LDVETAIAMVENLEFYRKKSAEMEDLANRVERKFSLTKHVSEEKIPELLKRKSSLQMNLESEIGGL
jgi:hypothetical protein